MSKFRAIYFCTGLFPSLLPEDDETEVDLGTISHGMPGPARYGQVAGGHNPPPAPAVAPEAQDSGSIPVCAREPAV